MSTTRISLLASVLFLSSLALGGCAVDAEDMPEGSLSENVSVTQTKTVSLPTQIDYVAPQCEARLVSTGPGPSIAFPVNGSCVPANPYTGQRRLAGQLETGMVVLLDEAKPGIIRCTPGLLGPICKKSPDQLIERLCTETRTYECPCGVASHQVDGYTVGACRNIPQ